VEPKSPLLDEQEQLKEVDYSDIEKKYLGGIRSRLEKAREAKDGINEDFDQMPYLTYFQMNERLGNSFVGAKKNKSDTNFQSGTINNKLWAFLASINRMNLAPEVLAFDKNRTQLGELGNMITEVLRMTEELEDDEEKRLIRQHELLKQGTVFVEDIWKKSYKTVKNIGKGFEDNPDKAKWTEKLVEYMSRPNRSVLYGPGVYLGSMSTFAMTDQPYAFTVDVVPYEQAKGIFGKWDRWDKVPHKLVQGDLSANWRLTEVENDKVEIIKYQDKPNDEFQIILNGVMMLPIQVKGKKVSGYPLSAVSCNGEYTFVKQVFKLIRHNFPYGKSLCMQLRNQVGVYDELIKMAILKSQKSAVPPMGNNTGQVLTSRVLMPGSMTPGIKAGQLEPLGETNGVTSGEVAMLNIISERIDESSVNKSYQGGESPGNTLGEAQIAQQQSDIIVDQAMWSCALLEKKLAELRLPILFKNWFEPQMDAPRDALTKYRVSNVETSIPNRGMGRSMVIPTEDIPSSEDIAKEEDEESERQGTPVRKYYLNPKEIKKAEYIWQVTVNPTPRRGDNQQKLMFRAEMSDAMTFFGPTLNPEYWQERFAENWNEDKDRAFLTSNSQQQPTPQSTSQLSPNQEKDAGIPRIEAQKVPTLTQ